MSSSLPIRSEASTCTLSPCELSPAESVISRVGPTLLMARTPFVVTANAVLYLAYLSDTKEKMVIKRLSLTPPSNTACCDHPMSEVNAYKRIQECGGHINIVHSVGVVVADDSIDLVLEFCAGGDLHSHLHKIADNRLPQHEALDVLLQVARGLHFLHRCGLAHRDISLENVLVTADGVCKLADFGLSTSSTASNDAVGKANYMAPEVVADMPYDPACADIWSLGIMFFILLTGSPLVKLASDEAADYRAFEALGGCIGVLKVWKMDQAFSKSTLDLLDGMLRSDAETRFHSMAEVLQHPAMVTTRTRNQ